MSARTIHPFPARMAPEIALDAIPEREGDRLTVIDPMCGSGTVLAVALQRGQNAIGVDIDPLAVMMSRLAVTPIDQPELEASATAVLTAARQVGGASPWGDDVETSDFVDFWFAPEQKSQLIALSHAIETLESDDIKLALQLALSRIIITKSPQASLAADTAHSRPHRVLETSEFDVFEGFRKSSRQLSTLLARRAMKGTGTAVLGDARLLTSVGDSSADLAVTSPPYLNALDYLRGHKLALVWFGYKISDLRTRRSSSIGAERAPDVESNQAVNEIVSVIETEAVDRSALRLPMLERFAGDCIGFAEQLHRTLKPGGKAVLVVGNSTLKGNYIRNDLIAKKAMEHAGFVLNERREREIPPSSRYMAISAKDRDSSITKRMRTEVVLTMGR